MQVNIIHDLETRCIVKDCDLTAKLIEGFSFGDHYQTRTDENFKEVTQKLKPDFPNVQDFCFCIYECPNHGRIMSLDTGAR
jgi:hypothetical protein